MASKINYNNKAPFQTLEEIPDENKVNADDMNEIKTVVNTNADELNTAKEDIENLGSGQGTASADITSLKNRVSTLETDNSTNKTNITNLQSNKVDKVKGKGLSTEDFTTELKSKLESLENYDDTEIKEDISNLEAGQTEQDKQIDMLINALPSETSEAENINLKGTIPVKFKEFKLSGNSKQETRSGKNIVNINSTDIVNIDTTIEVENNTLTVTGSSTTNFYSAIPINLKPNTDYSISTLATVVEQNGLSQSAYIRVRSDLAGSWIGNSILINKDSTTQQILKGTFNSGDNENAYLILYLSPLNDGTQRSAKIEFENLQIEEGTQATDYEPYGAMPSPEYPSPIQNVEGDVNVTVTNKNLFNSKKIQNSSIITVNDDNSITLSNNSNIVGYTDTKIKLKELAEGLKVGDLAYLKLITTYTGYSHIYIQGEYKGYWYNNTELVITQEILNSNVVLYGGYQKTDKLQIQITKNKLEDYVPYQQQTATFPLSEGQKLMQGDYLADDGIHHVRKQMELDGTENWELYSNRAARILKSDVKGVLNTTHIGNILSNFFKTETQVDLQTGVADNGIAVRAEGHNGIVIRIAEFTTLQEYKDWLSSKKSEGTPVIAEYELSEEEIEAYTPEQQEAYNQLCNLTAYEEETNIYSINEVGPVFTVTAVKNINSVITQLNTVLLERS